MRSSSANAPRRWWAARGRGAFADDERIQVSRFGALGDALFCFTSLRAFEEHGMGDELRSLAARCWEARGFGDYWVHVLVAEGSADVAVEPIMNLWDNAALQVVVEEAGGRFTDLDGRARSDGGNAVTTNGLLHDEVLEVLDRRGAG